MDLSYQTFKNSSQTTTMPSTSLSYSSFQSAMAGQPLQTQDVSFLQNPILATKNYLAQSLNQVKDYFTKPDQVSANPLSLTAEIPKEIASTAQQSFSQATDAVSSMLQDYNKGTGSTAGDVANLAKLASGVAGVLFSPVTGTFNTAEKIPGLKQIADAVNVPFTITGAIGAYSGGKLIDVLPISQQSKDILKEPISNLGSLVAQITLGGKVMGLAGDLLKTKGDITPQEATKIVEQAKTETPITTAPKITPAPTLSYDTFKTETTKPIETQPVTAPLTISKDLQPLAQEAQKYKSAEEFVKAQEPVYHGSHVPLKSFSNKKGGVFFTNEYDDATGFAGSPDNVYEGYLNFKNPLVIDAKGAKWDELNTKYGKSTQEVVGNAQKAGYDGVTFKNIVDNVGDTADWGGQSTIHYAFKPKDAFLNESQLTDIWNKVKGNQPTESVQVSRAQLPVGEGATKVSRLEARIKGKLDALTPEEQTGLSTYQQMNKADQIKSAVDFVTKNPQDALSILEGRKPAPKGLLYNSIFLAMEEQAHGDSALALKLSSLRSTRAGQEISILTERDPNSPVKYINDLQNAKIEAYGKEKLATEKKTEIGTAQKAVRSNNLVKSDWNAFIDSITC